MTKEKYLEKMKDRVVYKAINTKTILDSYYTLLLPLPNTRVKR